MSIQQNINQTIGQLTSTAAILAHTPEWQKRLQTKRVTKSIGETQEKLGASLKENEFIGGGDLARENELLRNPSAAKAAQGGFHVQYDVAKTNVKEAQNAYKNNPTPEFYDLLQTARAQVEEAKLQKEAFNEMWKERKDQVKKAVQGKYAKATDYEAYYHQKKEEYEK